MQVAAQGAKLSSSAISAAGGISITAGAVRGFRSISSQACKADRDRDLQLAGTFTGLLFMAMLFRPGHGESRRSVLTKEILAILCFILFLVAALLSTVRTLHRRVNGVLKMCLVRLSSQQGIMTWTPRDFLRELALRLSRPLAD